jgi:hypothetical protein
MMTLANFNFEGGLKNDTHSESSTDRMVAF